jgi:iron complex transport system substrate-binding protein
MNKPTVMTGMPQGENWYLTGGRNYFAQFMKDAGGDYLWSADTSYNGLTSTFEQVLKRASKAEIWLNPGVWSSRREALVSERRIELFDAWRKMNVFQHNKGYEYGVGSDFWDLGMMRPDLVLADLISILHPESLPAYQTTFYHRLP